MPERLDIDGYVDALLDASPPGELPATIMAVMSRCAAHLALAIGSRSASASVYGLADEMATQPVASGGAG